MQKGLLLSVIVAFLFVVAVCAGPTKPVNSVRTFGDAISAAYLDPTGEQTLFTYDVKEAHGAAITHWWMTGGPNIDDVRIRFYVDGETKPSIDIPLSLAVGVGFDDDAAPWGTETIGKGAHTGGVYNNIRIPFFKSIRITYEQPTGAKAGTFWWIVRGAEGILPITIGDLELPHQTRLKVYAITNTTYNPLDIVNVATIDNTGGALLMWTLVVASGNLNFLEGCVRCYIDGGPKILLSSGTEDYFDSAFYFDAGAFQLPVSGLTHLKNGAGPYGTQFSAYRFHDTDPIVFKHSFVFNWRNGDTLSPTNGQKCIDDKGNPAGNPQRSQVSSYAWFYLY